MNRNKKRTEKEIQEKIKKTEDRYFLFHYNCWQYDYYEEPAVAVISAMISSFERDRTIINKDLEDTVEAGYLFVGKKLKEIAGLYLKNRIGVDLISWAGEIASIKKGNASADYNFDKMFNFSQTIEMVRKDLQEMAEEGKDVELHCHFCNTNYVFTADELKKMV